MTRTEFLNFTHGKIGEIYVARKGTCIIFLIGDSSYLLQTDPKGSLVINPCAEYWTHAIDWVGGFSNYFSFGMCPPEKLTYHAKSLTEITPAKRAKLEANRIIN